MACFFSPKDIATLKAGREDVEQKFDDLRNQFFARNYKTDRGREYAHQGFCRRLDELSRAVEFVFTLLPPELEEIPPRDDVVAATMLIQSFFLNASGCLDNLAWIWVFETDQRGSDGKKIDPRWVGLDESCWYLRKSFTRPFRKHLSSRKKWFKHLREFRDSAAHRIPLYIPPYIISEGDAAKYDQLGKDSIEALQRGDYQRSDELKTEQTALGTFRPWMNHSLTEKSPTVVFHYQLLQDYVTVDEIARKMLTELDRFEELARRRAATQGGLFNKLVCWARAKADALKKHFV
jgi:hypothetical protein